MTGGAGAQRLAPAKVNLFLHVGDRRADGYHDLASLVIFADIADAITLRPSKALSLELSGPHASGLAVGPGNLVLKAARALESWATSHGHKTGPVTLTLEKNLPVASGIGGGSSDAAATLNLLCAHWALPVHDDDLQAIGLSLGADVPVCLRAAPTLMSGRGEILSPVSVLPQFSLVLVNPLVAVSTAAVFASLTARSGAFPRDLPAKQFGIRDFAGWLDQTINDLASPAKSLQPVIWQVEKALVSSDGCLVARMSGSGATCFGLYPTHDSATRAASLITEAHPHWWVRAGRMFANEGQRAPA